MNLRKIIDTISIHKQGHSLSVTHMAQMNLSQAQLVGCLPDILVFFEPEYLYPLAFSYLSDIHLSNYYIKIFIILK